MIRPPGFGGVAFSRSTDGDMRGDIGGRTRLAVDLGISPQWATVTQVHGAETVRVDSPGDAGAADAVWTTVAGLPLAVFTADCFGVVLAVEGAVGVAHCGWRGAVAGVVGALRRTMTAGGHEPSRAFVGPGIGPCCFEVGDEVADRLEPHRSTTTWGSVSVDLPAVIAGQLEGLEVWATDSCTRHQPGWFSHRRDGDDRRLASIAWVP